MLSDDNAGEGSEYEEQIIPNHALDGNSWRMLLCRFAVFWSGKD
jgi:hypothetical protein